MADSLHGLNQCMKNFISLIDIGMGKLSADHSAKISINLKCSEKTTDRDEENTVIRKRHLVLWLRVYAQKEGIDSKSHIAPVARQLEAVTFVITKQYIVSNKHQERAKPTEKHLTAVKRIFRYLKDSINMGLWYPKDTGFELTAFSDSDHAGCLDSRKSTSGGIQFLGGDKLVSWYLPKSRTALQCLPQKPNRFKYLVRRLGMRCLTPDELEVLAIESA
ncbi:hypothetical protein Tco_0572343 [Tanacetum coccineum]